MKKLPPKKERCTFIFSKTWQCRSVCYIWTYVIPSVWWEPSGLCHWNGCVRCHSQWKTDVQCPQCWEVFNGRDAGDRSKSPNAGGYPRDRNGDRNRDSDRPGEQKAIQRGRRDTGLQVGSFVSLSNNSIFSCNVSFHWLNDNVYTLINHFSDITK